MPRSLPRVGSIILDETKKVMFQCVDIDQQRILKDVKRLYSKIEMEK